MTGTWKGNRSDCVSTQLILFCPVVKLTWNQVYLACCCTCAPLHIDGLVQDCSISIANALEILQYCTKPSTCCMYITIQNISNVGVDESTNMWVNNILSSGCLRFSPFSYISCNIWGSECFSMAYCKTAVSTLLQHWRYCSLALDHLWTKLTD